LQERLSGVTREDGAAEFGLARVMVYNAPQQLHDQTYASQGGQW